MIWTDVKKQLPDTYESVLICWDNGSWADVDVDFLECRMDGSNVKWHKFDHHPPTHWMHKPKPPSFQE